MNKVDDYWCFREENNEIIDEFQNHITMTYDLLHPILLVMDHLAEHGMSAEGLSQGEVESLFEEGYYYLYNALDNIKNLLSNNFEDEIHELIPYDLNVYILLRLDEDDELSKSQNPLISKMVDQMYTLIENRTIIDYKTLEKIEEEIDEALSNLDTCSISDRFTDFADILNLDII